MNNGSPVTVCTTDASGHGTVAKANLPNGAYTLYSTVAKALGDMSSPFGKNVTITDNTTDIYVMPDGIILYWYGYKPYELYKTNTYASSYSSDNVNIVYNTNTISWRTTAAGEGPANLIQQLRRNSANIQTVNRGTCIVKVFGSANANMDITGRMTSRNGGQAMNNSTYVRPYNLGTYGTLQTSTVNDYIIFRRTITYSDNIDGYLTMDQSSRLQDINSGYDIYAAYFETT